MDFNELFRNTSGKFDMSILWTALGTVATILFTGVIGIITILQNHKIKVDKDEQLLLESGLLMLHGAPVIQDKTIKISFRNAKKAVILKCKDVSVKINDKKFNFGVEEQYFTTGSLTYGCVFPIECETDDNFINGNMYKFEIILTIKAENNLISSMKHELFTIFDNNVFNIIDRDYSKKLVKR